MFPQDQTGLNPQKRLMMLACASLGVREIGRMTRDFSLGLGSPWLGITFLGGFLGDALGMFGVRFSVVGCSR